MYTVCFVLGSTGCADLIERMENNDSSVTLSEILMSDKAKSMWLAI